MATVVSRSGGGSKNKAKDRRSRKRKLHYQQQHDVTTVNKIIRLATHVTDFVDYKSGDRLKQVVAVERQRALAKAKRRGNKRAIAALEATL